MAFLMIWYPVLLYEKKRWEGHDPFTILKPLYEYNWAVVMMSNECPLSMDADVWPAKNVRLKCVICLTVTQCFARDVPQSASARCARRSGVDGAALCRSSSAMAARPMFATSVSRRGWSAQWRNSAITVLNVLAPWWTSTTTGAAMLATS